MKVKTNWYEPHNYVAQENGSFEKKGSDNKNKPLKADFYIIKKEKKAAENFSMMLMKEFNGLRVSEIRDKETASVKTEKGDLKAVNFLNEYWA